MKTKMCVSTAHADITKTGYLDDEDVERLQPELMQPQRCATCQWWEEYEAPNWNDPSPATEWFGASISVSWTGACRRYPPTVSLLESDIEFDYPQTEHWEGCGEFKPEETP